MRRRSAVARLARKVLVGDLKEDFRITVKMIRMLPHTPRQNVKLQIYTSIILFSECCGEIIMVHLIYESFINSFVFPME